MQQTETIGQEKNSRPEPLFLKTIHRLSKQKGKSDCRNTKKNIIVQVYLYHLGNHLCH